VHVEELLPESMAPMCAAELLRGEHPLRTPSDLRHHQLIHDISVPTSAARPNWKIWLERARVHDIDPFRGLRCTLADLALQAAINRAGVVLGRVTLAGDDLRAGRLVMPFDLAIPADYRYFLLIARSKLRQPQVELLREWLIAQARDSQRLERQARKPVKAGARRSDPRDVRTVRP